MPIEALPPSTTQVIGATLVLNDAKSVVKELVDNALDARATAIIIEISQNTLDVIQVKDNGIGIGVQDRQLLCKKGCTSKIRSLEDLSRLGGSFLGFRGEALASIAELSSAVTVTTRVDGEIVGTALAFDSSRMTSSSSASHPVGTTFRVHKFLHNVPVRQQTALKSFAKTLQAIKALLLAFAFARPKVRFAFKILKARNEKGNWTYAPNPEDSLVDIASKIVGKDIALQCRCDQISSDEVDLFQGWKIDALLAAPDAEVSKIRNAPQYISIDGRPVAVERGTVKQIVKLYKQYLQATLQASVNLSISRPFLCLQIKCPSESYDVNIEPAKDEVLFFQPSQLLSLFEKLLKKIYQVDVESNGNDLSTEHVAPSPLFRAVDGTSSTAPVPMSGTVAASFSGSEHDATEDGKTLSRSVPSNPFVIAAMTARVQPKKMEVLTPSTLSSPGLATKSRPQDRFVSTMVSSISHRTPLGQTRQLISPSISPDDGSPCQNPGPPMRRRTQLVERHSPCENIDSPTSDDDTTPEHSKNAFMASWLRPSPTVGRSSHRGGQATLTAQPVIDHNLSQGHRKPESSRNGPYSPAVDNIPGMGWGPGQKAFKTPLKRSIDGRERRSGARSSEDAVEPVNADVLQNQTSRETSRRFEPTTRLTTAPELQQKDSFAQPGDETSPFNTELEDIMDFERRKKAAIAQHRRLAPKHSSKSLKDMLKPRASAADSPSLSASRSGSSVPQSQDPDVDVDLHVDFAARFGGARHSPTGKAASAPHNSQDKAADHPLSHTHPLSSLQSPPQTSMLDDHESHISESTTPTLNEDDPRAYLIRQRRRGGASKLDRTKSSKLPLETMPSGMMTLHLMQMIKIPQYADSVPTLVQDLASRDQYVVDGQIRPADLSQQSMPPEWRSILRELIVTKYRSQDGEGMKTKIGGIEIALP